MIGSCYRRRYRKRFSRMSLAAPITPTTPPTLANAPLRHTFSLQPRGLVVECMYTMCCYLKNTVTINQKVR
jgi:hypothetical protein